MYIQRIQDGGEKLKGETIPAVPFNFSLSRRGGLKDIVPYNVALDTCLLRSDKPCPRKYCPTQGFYNYRNLGPTLPYQQLTSPPPPNKFQYTLLTKLMKQVSS